MRGSKRLRGNTWELKAYAGLQVDPATGATKKAWVYDKVAPVERRGRVEAASERDADSALAALVARTNRARSGSALPTPTGRRRGRAPHLMTVREAFEAWRREVGPTLERNGRDQDRRDLEAYVYPHLGDVALWRLRPVLLGSPGDPDWDDQLVSMSDFYRTLSARGSVGRPVGPRSGGARKDAGGPLAPATVVRVAGVCQRAFAYCVARNWISANPATGARKPAIPDRRSTMPQPAVLGAFLRWLANNDELELLAFLHAVIYSGGRRLDIGVQWPEVDLEAGVITYVGRAVIIARSGPDGDGPEEVVVSDAPTKKRKHRVAALTPEGIAVLRDHHARALENAFDAGGALLPDAYVFSHDPFGATPVHPKYFSDRFRRARNLSAIRGMAGVRLYDCRHLLITALKAEGVPDSVIAERCGNSERTMDQKYRQRIDPADRAAAEALSRAMRAATGEDLNRG